MRRPIGVTIIAILTIIGGVLLTFGGISLLAFGAFFTSVPIDIFISEEMQQQQDLQNAAELHALARFLGGVGIAVGAIVLAVGIGYLVVSYGLLKGKGRAWTITVMLTIIAVQIVSGTTASMFNASFIEDTNTFVTGIIAQIVGIAINGVILYYLYRPNVKIFFGKSLPSTSIQG
jgi:magnesium-transporting ATPase (P-type)